MICKVLDRKEEKRSCGCCKDMVTTIQVPDGGTRIFKNRDADPFKHIPTGERFVWVEGAEPERIVRQLLEIEI